MAEQEFVYQDIDKFLKIKEKGIEILGSECLICQSKNNLEIYYSDWRDNSFSIPEIFSAEKSKFNRDIQKCQLFCQSCYAKKLTIDVSQMRNEIFSNNQEESE